MPIRRARQLCKRDDRRVRHYRIVLLSAAVAYLSAG
jgi:hypothetical protein